MSSGMHGGALSPDVELGAGGTATAASSASSPRAQREAMRALGERIAEAAAHVDAAMHRLLADLRTFDSGHGWYAQGAASTAHWLSWRVGWTLATGREHVRVARALATLPRIDDALRLGRLSYSKVRAITRVATPATEAALLTDALATTAGQLELICRKLRLVRRLNRQTPEDLRARRLVTRRDLDDGLVRLEVTLRPDEAAIVWAAIEHEAKRALAAPADAADRGAADPSAARPGAADPRAAGPGAADPDAVAPVVSDPRAAHPGAAAARLGRVVRRLDRVDGLLAMSQAALRGDAPARAPVEVVLTIPKAALAAAGTRPPAMAASAGTPWSGSPAVAAGTAMAEPDSLGCFRDGTCVSAEASRRLACDAGVVEIVEDVDGQPLSIGRKTRTIPAAIKRAVLHRDRTCRFPGCGNRLYLEGHHLRHWVDGGETSVDNVACLCARCHAFVHEHGYRIERTGDQLVCFDERGRPVPPEGPRPANVHLGWQAIRAANAAAGLGITAATNTCGWDGDPVQYGWVIDSLWSLERRAAPAAAG